ncbi:MAG: hypothetical protein ACRD8Z_25175, partial [Nitrososphaeraceae archaeon]
MGSNKLSLDKLPSLEGYTPKRFLVHNHIKDKRIPNSYPQLQGKIEAFNKIVKNEFLALEDIPNID